MGTRPVTIMHNSVSIDISLTGFAVDMGAHYDCAGSFAAGAHLVGSGTALAGIEMFGGNLRVETAADMSRSTDEKRPPWIIVDSQGLLEGKLHAYRNTEFGGDPIVLTSTATPKRYLHYLAEREYRHHVVGDKRVDLEEALQLVAETYGISTLLVDSGPGLSGVLLNSNLVDHISLIVVPVLVGPAGLSLFRDVETAFNLNLVHKDELEGGMVWLRYEMDGNR